MSDRPPAGPLAAWRQVLGVAAEFGSRQALPTWGPLALLLTFQLVFWMLATPGPTLLHAAPRGWATALLTVAASLLSLWLLPALCSRWMGVGSSAFGFRLGDARTGLLLCLGLLPLLPLLAWLAADPALSAVYPWVGAALAHPIAFLAWVPGYLLYYLAFEGFYRGLVIETLRPRLGLTAAVWLQALMATLIHLGKPTMEVWAAFPASLLFAAVALRTRSTLWPALLHLGIGLAVDLGALRVIAGGGP